MEIGAIEFCTFLSRSVYIYIYLRKVNSRLIDSFFYINGIM